jgi:hypothetical protein
MENLGARAVTGKSVENEISEQVRKSPRVVEAKIASSDAR